MLHSSFQVTWQPGLNFRGVVDASALLGALLGYVVTSAVLPLRGLAETLPEARQLLKAVPGSLGALGGRKRLGFRGDLCVERERFGGFLEVLFFLGVDLFGGFLENPKNPQDFLLSLGFETRVRGIFGSAGKSCLGEFGIWII